MEKDGVIITAWAKSLRLKIIMKRSESRISTTHVGSLIRPSKLLDLANNSRDGHEEDIQAFKSSLKETVVQVVKKQAEIDM